MLLGWQGMFEFKGTALLPIYPETMYHITITMYLVGTMSN